MLPKGFRFLILLGDWISLWVLNFSTNLNFMFRGVITKQVYNLSFPFALNISACYFKRPSSSRFYKCAETFKLVLDYDLNVPLAATIIEFYKEECFPIFGFRASSRLNPTTNTAYLSKVSIWVSKDLINPLQTSPVL